MCDFIQVNWGKFTSLQAHVQIEVNYISKFQISITLEF